MFSSKKTTTSQPGSYLGSQGLSKTILLSSKLPVSKTQWVDFSTLHKPKTQSKAIEDL